MYHFHLYYRHHHRYHQRPSINEQIQISIILINKNTLNVNANIFPQYYYYYWNGLNLSRAFHHINNFYQYLNHPIVADVISITRSNPIIADYKCQHNQNCIHYHLHKIVSVIGIYSNHHQFYKH